MPSIAKHEPILLFPATAIFEPGGKPLSFKWFAIDFILFLADAYDNFDPLSGDINQVRFPKCFPL